MLNYLNHVTEKFSKRKKNRIELLFIITRQNWMLRIIKISPTLCLPAREESFTCATFERTSIGRSVGENPEGHPIFRLPTFSYALPSNLCNESSHHAIFLSVAFFVNQ